jgi:glyoxalase superfamily protein
VFDASDIEAESGFWAGLLGGTVHRDEDWHSIVVDSDWVMGVQRAPNHVRCSPSMPAPPATRSASGSTAPGEEPGSRPCQVGHA